MNGLPRTPHERFLPAWLGVSVALHLAALTAGGALLTTSEPQRSGPPVTRVVLAGRITPAPQRPVTEPVTDERAPVTARPASPRITTTSRTHAVTRAARRVATVTPAMGDSPTPRTPPTAAAGGFSDDAPQSDQPHSASAPEMGRPGAAWAGPLAGGGAQPLAADAEGSSFQITSVPVANGLGPGYGGSGNGLGAGGTAGGIGGGGTPGGEGPASGGVGGGTTGQVDPSGDIGGGGAPARPAAPGPGTSAAGGNDDAPAATGATAPSTRPAPEPKPEPAPETRPEPAPQPSPADLSAFRAMVQRKINSARRYPSSARDAGQQGTVRVTFRVSPSGRPSGIRVASSSGHQSLDAAAKRAVSAAAPYRPFPRHMNSSIRVTATVIFRLN